jgi:hypothetical protein
MSIQEVNEKYSEELLAFETTSYEDRWLELLGDLANVSESNWDFITIRYEVVMNQKEWDEFAYHPERLQYKSKIQKLRESDYNTVVYPFILEVLKDSYELLESIEDSEFKTNLRKKIAALLDYSTNARYLLDEIRVSDKYKGRSEQDRDNGVVEPTQVDKTKFRFAIEEYSRFSNKDFDQLYKKIYDICDGRMDTLITYYYSCNMDLEFRKDLWEIFQIHRIDRTLAHHHIQLGWDIWKSYHEIGLDTDKWLKLIGFNSLEETKKNLLALLENEEINDELLKHLEDDLPQTFQKYQDTGEIDTFLLWHENVERKGYPGSLKTKEQTDEMISESKVEVYKYFPLAQNESPKCVLLNPTHPAATTRAFQSGTRNEKGELVSVIVMTPRIDQKDDYLSTFAHESIHALHKLILSMGEESAVLPVGSSEGVSGSVSEVFTVLVEEQFSGDQDLPYDKKYKGHEFGSFYNGYVTRHQSPYALVQLSMREIYDDLWSSGYRDQLSQDMIRGIESKMDIALEGWYSTGLNFIRKDLRGTNLFVSYNPDDGLVYLRKYVVKELEENSPDNNETSAPKERITISDAFKKRFGDRWIDDRDARIVLHWLLLESGRNDKSELYGELVINAKITDMMEELKQIGVREEDLG